MSQLCYHQESGKMSCCSWFNNCGAAGNTKLDRTWYEGMQACKSRGQSKTMMDQQQNVAKQNSRHGNDADTANSPNSVIMTHNTFTSTSVNSSAPMPETTQIFMSSVNASTAASIRAPIDFKTSHMPTSTSTEYGSDTVNPETIISAPSRMIGSLLNIPTPSTSVTSNVFVNTSVNVVITTSMDTPFTNILITDSYLKSESTPITVQGCEYLLYTTIYVNLLIIIIL